MWFPLLCPLLGTWPETQACALTGNWTSDPLVCRLVLNHWATPDRSISRVLFTLCPEALAQILGSVVLTWRLFHGLDSWALDLNPEETVSWCGIKNKRWKWGDLDVSLSLGLTSCVTSLIFPCHSVSLMSFQVTHYLHDLISSSLILKILIWWFSNPRINIMSVYLPVYTPSYPILLKLHVEGNFTSGSTTWPSSSPGGNYPKL